MGSYAAWQADQKDFWKSRAEAAEAEVERLRAQSDRWERLARELESRPNQTAEVKRLREAWEKDNLCGICPYRRSVQEENERLRIDLEIRDDFIAEAEHVLSAYGVSLKPKRPLSQMIHDLAAKRHS